MSIFMIMLLALVALVVSSAMSPNKVGKTMTAERWEQLNPGQPYPLDK